MRFMEENYTKTTEIDIVNTKNNAKTAQNNVNNP